MEILTILRRLYISFKYLVNDSVYCFGRAALLLLVEVQNHTVPVRERRRIRVNILIKAFFFSVGKSPARTQATSVLRFLNHTQLDTHTHTTGLLLTIDQLIATQTQTKIHDPSEIRTCNTSNRAATDLLLRPHIRPYGTFNCDS